MNAITRVFREYIPSKPERTESEGVRTSGAAVLLIFRIKQTTPTKKFIKLIQSYLIDFDLRHFV